MENKKPTPQEALGFIYQATRLAPLNANEHDKIKEAAIILQDALAPKEEPKKK